MSLDLLIGKVKEAEKNSFKLPHELVKDWVERVKLSIERPLSTGFKRFDDDLENVLRGEICAVIGYGGTKKSLWSLNQSNLNANRYKARTVYSTMEMSSVRLLDRVIDFCFGDVHKSAMVNASREFRLAVKSGNEKVVIKDLTDLLEKYYGDKLLIDAQPAMTYEKYDLLIEQVKQKHGEVDCLVVDGLGMMDSLGTENESYSTHTKMLKRLAIKHDIFIPIICHVSKGTNVFDKNMSRYTRGSEKILDNVDFYLMFSLLQDEFYETIKNYGRVMMVNKRGSGNTIEQIYKFNQYRLLLEDTDLDPKQFDVESKEKW